MEKIDKKKRQLDALRVAEAAPHARQAAEGSEDRTERVGTSACGRIVRWAAAQNRQQEEIER